MATGAILGQRGVMNVNGSYPDGAGGLTLNAEDVGAATPEYVNGNFLKKDTSYNVRPDTPGQLGLHGQVWSRLGNTLNAFEKDNYYIAADEHGTLWSGYQLNGAQTITWKKAPTWLEDEDTPGCYYRMVDGEKEWLNPPMKLNFTYRTTERRNGKPVYRRYACTQGFPTFSSGIAKVDIIPDPRIVVVDINAFIALGDRQNTFNYPLPYIRSSESVTIDRIINGQVQLRLIGESSWDNENIYFDVKYVKY